MTRFKIVDETGRAVAHLKRVRNGNQIDVSVWFDGDPFWPTGRSRESTRPIKLQGAVTYNERTAKAWLGSLERAGRAGFKAVAS